MWLNINAHRAAAVAENPDTKWLNGFPSLFYNEEESTERATLTIYKIAITATPRIDLLLQEFTIGC